MYLFLPFLIRTGVFVHFMRIMRSGFVVQDLIFDFSLFFYFFLLLYIMLLFSWFLVLLSG